jgi:hypothetical protein
MCKRWRASLLRHWRDKSALGGRTLPQIWPLSCGPKVPAVRALVPFEPPFLDLGARQSDPQANPYRQVDLARDEVVPQFEIRRPRRGLRILTAAPICLAGRMGQSEHEDRGEG